MTTEFQQRQQAAIASGMVPMEMGYNDPVLGSRPTGPLGVYQAEQKVHLKLLMVI